MVCALSIVAGIFIGLAIALFLGRKERIRIERILKDDASKYFEMIDNAIKN